MNEKIKLLLADDHHILLDGLRALIANQADMTVLGSYENGRLLLEAVPEFEQVDVVLADISMPEMNGHQLTLKIKETYPDIAVIILSMHDDGTHIMDMVEAGVSGYVLKNANDGDLLEAIRMVHGGGMYFSPEVSAQIAALVHHRQQQRDAPPEVTLTSRELDVLRLVGDELTNAEIGDKLFISERTVETHRKNMLRKTGSKSIVGLIKHALEAGWI